VPFWMSSDYKIRRDLERAKMHYQKYWGFGHPDFSVVHAVNLVPVFSLAVGLLLGFCFPAFVAERVFKCCSWTNVKRKFILKGLYSYVVVGYVALFTMKIHTYKVVQ